jgi:uncharacterized membrane protein YfcA
MDFPQTALVLAALAALLVGFSKTGMPGAGIPAVALMAEAFREDVRLSVGAMLPILIVGDLFAIAYYRRHADWSHLWRLFPYVLAGMVPGYLVLWYVKGTWLRRLLGGLIVTLLAMHVLGRRLGWERQAQRKGFAGVSGVLAGFGTTVGNAAGPIMSVYLASQRMEKHEFLGTAAWFFFLVNVSKIPFFAARGMITSSTLRLDLMLVPIVVCGAVIGAAVLKRIPQPVFDVLVVLLAGVAGLRLLLF